MFRSITLFGRDYYDLHPYSFKAIDSSIDFTGILSVIGTFLKYSKSQIAQVKRQFLQDYEKGKIHNIDDFSLIFFPSSYLDYQLDFWTKEKSFPDGNSTISIVERIRFMKEIAGFMKDVLGEIRYKYPVNRENRITEILLVDSHIVQYFISRFRIPPALFKNNSTIENNQWESIYNTHRLLMRHTEEYVRAMIKPTTGVDTATQSLFNDISPSRIYIWKFVVLPSISPVLANFLQYKNNTLVSFIKQNRTDLVPAFQHYYSILNKFKEFIIKTDDTFDEFRYRFSQHVKTSETEVQKIVYFLHNTLAFVLLTVPSSLPKHVSLIELLHLLIVKPYREVVVNHFTTIDDESEAHFFNKIYTIPALFVIELHKIRQIIDPTGRRKSCGSEKYARQISYILSFLEAFDEPTNQKYTLKRKHQESMVVERIQRQISSFDETNRLHQMEYESIIKDFNEKFQLFESLSLIEIGDLVQLAITMEVGGKRPGEFRFGFVLKSLYDVDLRPELLKMFTTQLSTKFTKKSRFCVFLVTPDKIEMIWNISKCKDNMQSIERIILLSPSQSLSSPRHSGILMKYFIENDTLPITDYRKIDIYTLYPLFRSSKGTMTNRSVSVLQLTCRRMRKIIINIVKKHILLLCSNPLSFTAIKERMKFSVSYIGRNLLEAGANVSRHSMDVMNRHYSDHDEITENKDVYLEINQAIIAYYSKIDRQQTFADFFIQYIITDRSDEKEYWLKMKELIDEKLKHL